MNIAGRLALFSLFLTTSICFGSASAFAACVPQMATKANGYRSVGCNVDTQHQRPTPVGPITHRVPTQKEIDLYNSPANAKNRPVIYPANSNVTLGIREAPPTPAAKSRPRPTGSGNNFKYAE